MKTNNGMFQMQLSRMVTRSQFKIAWVLSFAFIAVAFAEECFSLWGTDRSVLYSASSGWIGNASVLMGNVMQVFYFFAIFMIAALPFSDSFLEDRKNHSLAPVLTRGTWNSYWRSGILLTFLGGFLVIFIPLLVSQLLSFLLFPVSGGKMTSDWGGWSISSTLSEGYVFPYLAFHHPYLHNILFVFYSSFLAGLTAVGSYLLSLLGVHKKLLVLGLPTIFWVIYTAVITFIAPGLVFQVYLYPNENIFKESWFFFALPLCVIAILLIGCLLVKKRKMEAALL